MTETGVLVTRILRLVNIGQLTFSILNWCCVVSFAAIIRYIMQHFSQKTSCESPNITVASKETSVQGMGFVFEFFASFELA